MTQLAFHIHAGRPWEARDCGVSMRSAIRALPPGRHPASALVAWGSLPTLYHRWAMGPGGEQYLVAQRGGKQLGFAARRGGELTAVFVRPPEQGRGVGRALVFAAARGARRNGYLLLRVTAALAAVPFYARLGFRPGASAWVPLPSGPPLRAQRMRLVVEVPTRGLPAANPAR